MIKVKLRDDVREFENGTTPEDIAKQISMGLYKNLCACLIDGESADIRTPLEKDCSLELLNFESAEGKHAFWHTSSHILAQAVKRLYPDAKLAIGPAIENGFYYDFDCDTPFTPEVLEKIEAEMKKVVKEDLYLERFELEPAKAIEFMQEKGEPYKVELIEEHAGKNEPISFYKQGEYVDVCAGPHIPSTGRIKAFKLTACTGAYWRADQKNKMLQRIYGIAFPKKEELDAYIERMEEAKKRDHRKIGKELGLFMLTEEGPGFPFFLPNGMILKNTLIEYWREVHKRYGYVEISTPIILNQELWHRSGHWDHYKDNMYTTVIDEEDYAVKPMNCPGGMLVFKSEPHSYRDLPLRCGELGLVHRHELSGALHGLFRVRCFTQDDAHIFMTRDQIKEEIIGVTRLFDEVYSLFGLKYKIELSTMPDDHMGSLEDWELATNALKNAMESLGKEYEINEGDGAFYGPKLDFHLEDSIGRTWQCGTIQLDFQMPERFELEYTGADGEKHRPVMIHRVVFGSIERFVGVITEHFAGAFPTWLAPEQVRILPISEKHLDFAETIRKTLYDAGIRVELDTRSEKIGYKIREAQLRKIPYMLIVGDKEAESGTVSVRSRSKGDIGSANVDKFLSDILNEISSRSL
ncbi:MAG: threonine--tRNA ligase [Clostridiales bacterium]|nr:threonine--tRNA ligase [Clostridiales bacterium]